MAKIRSIHPELCTDETLAEVSARAERTFIRLLPHLDDAGRAVDNAKLLKAQLYPLHEDVTSADVDQDLDELASAGLVLRYTAAGRGYLSAKPTAWERWQKPRWRYPSKLPAPADTEHHEVPHTSDVRPTANRRAPAHVGRTSDRAGVGVGVGVGVGEEAAAAAAAEPSDARPTSSARPTPDGHERQQRLEAAIEILVQRHLDAHPSRNPKRHTPAVRAGKLNDHHHDGHQLLAEHPTLTAEQLADILEPASVPAGSLPPLTRAALTCTSCDGGTIPSPTGRLYCPECNPHQAQLQRAMQASA